MPFNVCLHSCSFPLLTDWQKSDSSVDREPQGNWRWNLNSRDEVASSPSFSRPAARAPREACSQASAEFIDPSTVFFLKSLMRIILQKSVDTAEKSALTLVNASSLKVMRLKRAWPPPPPPPEYKRLSIFGETWQCHYFIRLSFKLCRRIFTNCWEKKKTVERSIWKIVVLMVRV